MEIKLFSELIDALDKVVGGLKAVAKLPQTERNKYRQIMDDTYRLIDTTLNMVIIRLGDILLLLPDKENEFMQEVMKLDNYAEWIQAEREFRLCKSLREALRETETMSGKLTGHISARDWDALLKQMRSILATEGEVAVFIGQQFNNLANAARNDTPDKIKKHAVSMRDALIKERQTLIQQEIKLYNLV